MRNKVCWFSYGLHSEACFEDLPVSFNDLRGDLVTKDTKNR